MKKIIAVLGIITLFSCNGQSKCDAQDCNCESNFEWMKKTFEENDAGFQYIIDTKGTQAYNIHNALSLEKIKSAQTSSECTRLLYEWLTFFRSGHIGIEPITPKEPNNNPTNNQQDTQKPYIEDLNPTTLLLKIPSFYNAKTLISSVIVANKDKILHTKNLIIDVRNNGGGSSESFSEILPLLYTNPIRKVGVEYLSTKLNNQRMLDLINGTVPDFPEDRKKWAKEAYDNLEAHLGEYVNVHDSTIVSVYELDTIYAYPQNIGIIINGGCVSATEDFLYEAKQSKKVKLFGTTTFGAMDISNMYFVESPCKEFKLWYGLSKSYRIPEMTIDNKGIQPDYYLDKSIPQDKWVDFVKEVLNK
jgi:hypothetical protein